MFDLMTFGETMIRLSPPGHGRLEAAETLECRIGGSESNTAVALSRLGRHVTWWSRLPENGLGRRIASQVARWGVDTSAILWTPTGRVGVYFIEFGSPPRPHEITYDRADSAVSCLTLEEVDWSLLDSTRRLHLTGITPALSDSCAAVTLRALQEAASRRVPVSLDVNYRSKLWSPQKARETLTPLLPFLDTLLCPGADAHTVFQYEGDPMAVARIFQETYGVPRVIITAATEGVYAVEGKQTYHVEAIPSVTIDRVGAGDAFGAGLLHGLLDGDLHEGLRYGVAMAALKHTLPGDELLCTRDEIEAVVRGVTGSIRR